MLRIDLVPEFKDRNICVRVSLYQYERKVSVHVRTRRKLPLKVGIYIRLNYLSASIITTIQSSQLSTLTLYPPTKSSIIMRFSAAILTLAASAAAVAVPRANGDSWDVMISKYDAGGITVTAHFLSVTNPDTSRFGSRFTCIIDDKPTPNWCDHDGVSADWDGKSESQPRRLDRRILEGIWNPG
jgi:hypothetical protein